MSGLVAKRPWIYPADVEGRFHRLRRNVAAGLIAFFVLAPWIRVGDLPLVRIDIPGRRLVLAGQIFTPHDTWALALLLLGAAIALFLVTSALGRIWCGWACPQTVWLDFVYRPIDRWIEGSAHKRKKRDEGPRDAAWWRVKVLKQALYLGATFGTTMLFLAWFVGGPELLRGDIGATGVTIGVGLFLTFYIDAIWFREQLCHYACPYARFQGVLMDDRSLAVAYDASRGEPRSRRKGEGGDCVDCTRCVQVCAMGIDIRDGDQLQCTHCTACADACDAVMIKIGKPTGLIRYTTKRDEPAFAGQTRIPWRPRLAVYSALLAVISVGLAFGLVTRSPMMFWAARAPSAQVYRTLPDGRIANQYNLHMTNKDRHAHTFTVQASTEDVQIMAPGQPWTIGPGEELRLPVFVSAPAQAFQAGRVPARVELRREDGRVQSADVALLGPQHQEGA